MVGRPLAVGGEATGPGMIGRRNSLDRKPSMLNARHEQRDLFGVYNADLPRARESLHATS